MTGVVCPPASKPGGGLEDPWKIILPPGGGINSKVWGNLEIRGGGSSGSKVIYIILHLVKGGDGGS